MVDVKTSHRTGKQGHLTERLRQALWCESLPLGKAVVPVPKKCLTGVGARLTAKRDIRVSHAVSRVTV